MPQLKPINWLMMAAIIYTYLLFFITYNFEEDPMLSKIQYCKMKKNNMYPWQ